MVQIAIRALLVAFIGLSAVLPAYTSGEPRAELKSMAFVAPDAVALEFAIDGSSPRVVARLGEPFATKEFTGLVRQETRSDGDQWLSYRIEGRHAHDDRYFVIAGRWPIAALPMR